MSTLRISILVLCMATAARSDFETLSVRDGHWIRWSAPASLILILELASNDAGLANICMAFALLAVFSICFYTPPDPRKIGEWNSQEALLWVLYSVGIGGIVTGAYRYSDTDFIDLVLGDETLETTLWWSMIGALITSVIYYASWRAGLIQGGADVKALILITLIFPSWGFVPEQMFSLVEDPIFRMPPSMVMFIWAAAAFLIAPPLIFIHNASKGNIETISDLKMAWHATRKKMSDLEMIPDLDDDPSWILTEAIEKNGKTTVVNRILPSSKSAYGKEKVSELALLQELGLESVWITRKHPFLVYLFFAILPMLLFGDPIAFLIK